MRYLTIERSYTPLGTLGRIDLEDARLWTLELPWRGNECCRSCIPEGVYRAIKHDSPTFGPTLWLRDVPERSEILLHPANYVEQLDGCIAPGSGHGTARDALAVWDSQDALERILQAVDDEVNVDIRTYRPEYP